MLRLPGRRSGPLRLVDTDRRRRGFVARLFVSSTMVLVAVGLALHVSQGRALRAILVQHGVERHESEARLIQRTFSRAADPATARREVSAILAQVQSQPDVHTAFVVDSAGTVLVAGRPQDEATTHLGPGAEAVFRTGRSRFDTVEEGGMRLFEYSAPVDLPTGRMVLEVEEDPILLERQLAALRRSSLQALGSSLLVALPLLWLLGGRSLAGRYRSAEERSSRDSLTDRGNHRRFQEEIHKEAARTVRQGSSLSVAMVDVDDFKVVNDRRGHRHGDDMLVALGAVMRDGRTSDRAFRVGGDEFALLLPDTDEEGALVVAEELRIAAANRLPGTTVSIGVATLSAEGDGNLLRDQADAALYHAKRLGRDRVVAFREVTRADVPLGRIHALRRFGSG